jgi:hypothetical protein
MNLAGAAFDRPPACTKQLLSDDLDATAAGFKNGRRFTLTPQKWKSG